MFTRLLQHGSPTLRNSIVALAVASMQCTIDDVIAHGLQAAEESDDALLAQKYDNVLFSALLKLTGTITGH